MTGSAWRGTAVRTGLVLGLLAACWPVWELGGWLAEKLGLAALDLLVRVCAVFLFLSLVETVLTRVPLGRQAAPDSTMTRS